MTPKPANCGGLASKDPLGPFDAIAIIILASGVYLWLARRESQVEVLLGAASGVKPPSSLVQVAGE